MEKIGMKNLKLNFSMPSEENADAVDNVKFKCKHCNKEFHYRRNYILHRAKHRKELIAPCFACKRRFTSSEYWKIHGPHCPLTKKFTCHQCKMKFRSKSLLDRHKKFHRKFSLTLTCQFCSRAFSHKVIFRAHLRTHMGKRLYCCQTCGKSFSNDVNLLQHESLHGSYKCTDCHRAFPKLHQLKQHRLKDHSEGTGHKCTYCGAAFTDANRLKTHIKNCDAFPSSASASAGSSK